MKDLHITLGLRNNRLIEKREALGLSQIQVSKLIGINRHVCNSFECLRRKPRYANGQWCRDALALADFYHCDPEDIFPLDVSDLDVAEYEYTFDATEMLETLEYQHNAMLALPPDELLALGMREDRLNERLTEMLATLSPMERQIVVERYNLDGKGERNYVQISERFGLSRTRIANICECAFRKLGNRKNRSLLEEFRESKI